MTMSSRVLAALAAIGLCGAAGAQEGRLAVRVSFGQSLLALGSEDIRNGAGIALDYAVPSRRLAFRRLPAELVMEGYVNRTHSTGASGKPPNTTLDYGVLALARYTGATRGAVAAYVELGWGLQYTTRRSVDLDSRLNSTPTFGAGLAISGARRAYVGVRLMHISNAGLSGRNQGQNQFMVTMSVRL